MLESGNNLRFMKNYLVSKTFYEIADMLEIQDVPFKPQAYRKVARVIEAMPEDIEELYRREQLNKIPGVGTNIQKKIEELLQTGKLEYYETLRKELPMDFEDLLSVEGVGPRMVKTLYEELGIKTIKDLEKSARQGKVSALPHYGEKIEQKILMGIKFFKRSEGRFLLGSVLPSAQLIVDDLKQYAEEIEIAGSIRRRNETAGDIDLVAVTDNPEKIIDVFVKMPDVALVESKGTTRSSVRLQSGLEVDLRVVARDSFGSALQYFTGNKEHNIELRKIASTQGLKLNEYGLFKKTKNKKFQKIEGEDEKGIYKMLGLQFIEPELREMKGEIEASKNAALPTLITRQDLKGDLHTHTQWSEGSATIEEMAERARESGMEYIAITDHAGHLKVANALDGARLLRQIKEIDRINAAFKKKYFTGRKITILKGAEVDINKNGTLDIEGGILAKLDIVVASVHSDLKMPKKEMTQRVITAMQNPFVNVIAHPTGRIIRQREASELDWDVVFSVAKENNIAMEINSWPERLDLRDEDIREAIIHGVKLVISSDSHSLNHLSLVEFGIMNARRGWAEKGDILNTLPVDKVLGWFRKK